VLRYYRVFNAAQADHLPARFYPVPGQQAEIAEPQQVLDRYLAGGPRLLHVPCDRADYHPVSDTIRLPLRSQFRFAEDYYATAFHEAGHSTGHPDRLNRSFVAKPLADSFRDQLQEAARKGESFSTETGLPQSLARRERHVTCYEHAEEFVKTTWPSAAAKSRISTLETFSAALPVLTRDLTGAPDPDVLRLAVRHALNRNEDARGPDAAELGALGWLKRASLPVSALEDPEVAFDLLDALGRKLDGSPASRTTTPGAAGSCTEYSATPYGRNG
jgi:hypothetical protein